MGHGLIAVMLEAWQQGGRVVDFISPKLYFLSSRRTLTVLSVNTDHRQQSKKKEVCKIQTCAR
jgi:hypothetical protein